MALHGRKRHVKRLAASTLLPIARKGHKFLKKASAGRHRKLESIPLLVLVRDVLGIATSNREAKTVLSAGEVLVDGLVRREGGFPVGFMDVVAVPKLKSHYRIIISHGKFAAQPIADKDASVKLCKVVGKKLVKGGRIQLAFHDGRTQMIEKEEDRFSLGDTIKLKLPVQVVEGFLKLEKGANCYIHSGRHAGETGVLESVLERAGSTSSEVKLKAKDHELITRKDYVLVVEPGFTTSHK